MAPMQNKKPELTNPLNDLFGYRIHCVSAIDMQILAKELTAFDVTIAAASVLIVINANPAAIQSDIGRILGIKRANMVPLITDMENKKLIKRVPVDGRSYRLKLTTAGTKAAQGVLNAMYRCDENITRNIDADEIALFTQLIDKIHDRIGAQSL